MKLLRDVQAELQQFLSGRTVDVIIPPIIYVLMNNFFTLKIAVFFAILTASIFTIKRLIRKESILYAIGGVASVAFASGFALLSDNATNYFLPKIIGSGFLFILLLISLLLKRPAAGIMSHLSRGWSFEWFMREDVNPAYREVTIVWTLLAFLRMIIQINLYRRGNVIEIGWASILLGFPATLTVLILTLIYGVWRLKKLGGPGIHEFEAGKEPPWEGQKKGF